MSGGDVTININDGGANASINVPSTSLRIVMGCVLTLTASFDSSVANPLATANQLIQATQAAQLVPYFGAGKTMEAAGLDIAAGATVVVVGVPVVTKGVASTVVPTIPGGSGSAVTVTVDGTNGSWDDLLVMFRPTTGGTIGVAGIFFQISLDAGRSFGPVLPLGTANSYIIPRTGVQLNFGAGTLVAGDYWRFNTTAPSGNTAGWQAALLALQASSYALSGWGGIHLADTVSGSAASTLQTALGGSPDGTAGLAKQYTYTRMLVDVRDAAIPTAWGGSGETEAAWMTSIQTDYSATTAVRICANAGNYNMPSAYANPAAGAPAYRRNLAWALDPRQAVIPPQRHAGRVKDGSLGAINVNATTDPNDGFIRHDERLTPGLTPARFCAAKTRVGKTGFFIDQPNLMRGSGSVYTILPLGLVMDVGCFVVFQSAEDEIDDDVRLNPDATMFETDRLSNQSSILQAINVNMTSVGMLSPGSTVVIDPSAPIGITGNVPITVSLAKRGYILTEVINIGFATPTAAGG